MLFAQPQAEAFVRGLWEVIDPQWLQMFSEPELQVLISGSNKTLDVEDLKRHTRQAITVDSCVVCHGPLDFIVVLSS